MSVWGAVPKDGLGPPVRLEGRFNAEAYCDVIASIMVPSALDGSFPYCLYYFQQDRSPIHMAKSVTCLLEQLGVMVLEWPPQGAGINICEKVWGAIKKALSRRPLQCDSQDALWAAVEEGWGRLRTSDFAARLFDSNLRRMAAVVAAGVNFNKY
ncbi:uncharacterized protein [Dermacentor andersoni]|uniref:uncharacterized protein n=1 Tax=Dermacentor andersoni TaxID=34620 RepID=UPI003B3BDAED